MTIVADSLADAARMVERVDAKEGVAFRTKGLLMPEDRVLMPFHLVYEEHYTMYFPVMSTKEWAEKAPALAREAAEKAAVAARTVDEVEPGFQQSEVNHAWKGFGDSTGDFRDRKWRHAQGRDGWFSYELAVDPKSPMELVATYFAGDRGRSFDVFVDGTLMATEPCGPDPRRDEMYEKAYRIPLGLTRGKKTVTVKFAGNPKTSFVGGLFGLASRRVPSGPAF